MRAADRTARQQLHDFLRALARAAFAGSYFELRERHGQPMRRRFYPTEFPDRAVSAILRASRARDVYLGAAPRARTHGDRTAIAFLTALWVDADTAEAFARLQTFAPAPSLLVASGRGQRAYWLLEQPVDLDTGERPTCGSRIAWPPTTAALTPRGSCAPPHTTSYQHQPARPVRLLRLAAQQRHALATSRARCAASQSCWLTTRPSRCGRSRWSRSAGPPGRASGASGTR